MSTAPLLGVLARSPQRMVACSGGVDSLLLATVAHREAPNTTVVAHAVGAAVPHAATARVEQQAEEEGWNLELVTPGEFSDERYLANPADRCYFCKDHLYSALESIGSRLGNSQWTLMSGANVDDLGEYRPGLRAAGEHLVRHPFIEAGWAKADIRRAARHLGLNFSELPAAPCLASRLYTGTRVTPTRLRAVEAAEELVRRHAGIEVVRCRIRQDIALIEVTDRDRSLISEGLLDALRQLIAAIEPSVLDVRLDDRAYRPGRAFLVTQSTL